MITKTEMEANNNNVWRRIGGAVSPEMIRAIDIRVTDVTLLKCPYSRDSATLIHGTI